MKVAATSADLARAICLRGLFAAGDTIDVRFNEMQRDNFEAQWEELPAETQSGWLTVAALVDRVSRTPGWSGSLTPDVAEYIRRQGGK